MQRKTASYAEIESPQIHKKQPTPSNIHKQPERNDRNAVSSFDVRLVNPEQEMISNQEQTLKKLLEMNENYLHDKVKISDVPKPSKYAHKVPSKTGSSQYNRKYTSVPRPYSIGESTPQRDKTGSILKLPNHLIVGYESTYHKDFTQKKQEDQSKVPQSPQKPNKKYVKSQAPGFIQSSYHRDYQTVAPSPAISAKRAQIKLMGGGKLDSDTTYKHCYRLKTIDAIQPIIHKDNKIFIKMQNPQSTQYQSSFNNSKQNKAHKQISCKPIQKYNPNPNKLKYKTEYNDVFLSPQMSRKKEFQCLSKEQLKKYMMNILNE